MKRFVPLALTVALMSLCGCMSTLPGPWKSPKDIAKKYDKIEIGMERSEVEDILHGTPSDTIAVTDKDGQPIPGSKELWMRYKYDYPAKPILISIKLDNFGKVSEKHLDDLKTVAELGKPKTEQERASYPGAPSKKFQELIKKKTREGSQ